MPTWQKVICRFANCVVKFISVDTQAVIFIDSKDKNWKQSNPIKRMSKSPFCFILSKCGLKTWDLIWNESVQFSQEKVLEKFRKCYLKFLSSLRTYLCSFKVF